MWYMHLPSSLFLFLALTALFQSKDSTQPASHYVKVAAAMASSSSSSQKLSAKQRPVNQQAYDYDLIIIGSGASGMFAAGTSSSFGCRTLLVEKLPSSFDKNNPKENVEQNDFDLEQLHVGGDCTNAACVPSKAMRSISNMAAIASSSSSISDQEQHNENVDWFHIARKHSVRTVEQVRSRESIERLASVPNLDLVFVSDVSFVSSNDVALHQPFWCSDDGGNDEGKETTKLTTVRSKKFLIATGANPVQPSSILNAAKKIKLPVFTYRSLFRPDGEGKSSDEYLWNILSPSLKQNLTESNITTTSATRKKKNVVIAGGGPVGCEVAQIVSRLARASSCSINNTDISITIVTPMILSSEDVAVRCAAREMLKNDGVSIISNNRLVDAVEGKEGMKKCAVITDENNNSTTIPADVLILAMGREPGTNLEQLNLQNAGVQWTKQDGITVHSNLRSVSAKHVYAAGDCASAVQNRDRRAVHAGWTGYHAVQSAFFPKFFKPKSAVHPFVPRVIFTNPEIASIGMSYAECVREYGPDGFRSMREYEIGTDRADTDSLERDTTVGFVELRVSHLHGRVLGATIVSPSASELINEVGVALVHGMSCRNIARCLHSYPSHGYLMYRVSLALALSDVWGLLSACGPLGRVASVLGGSASYALTSRGRRPKWWWRKSRRNLRDWESMGADREFIDLPAVKEIVNCTAAPKDLEQTQRMRGLSFIEVSKDIEFCNAARKFVEQGKIGSTLDKVWHSSLFDFVKWLNDKPV